MLTARFDCWRVMLAVPKPLAVGVIVNAIPKSGTHLLLKLLELLGFGWERSPYLAPRNGKIVTPTLDASGLLVLGDDEVSLAALRYATITRDAYAKMADQIACAPNTACFEAHQLWSKAGAKILAERQIKQLIIMRDPRGAALSHAEWTVDPKTNHHLRELLLDKSLSERLAYEFFGLPADTDPRFEALVPLIVRYRNTAPWTSYPFMHVATFEALSGAEGEAAQLSEIEAIARFVGQEQFDRDLMQRELWGNSLTFRHGVADRWRQHLSEFPAGISDQIEEMLAIVERMKTRGVAPRHATPPLRRAVSQPASAKARRRRRRA
jgi:hypothetical protein